MDRLAEIKLLSGLTAAERERLSQRCAWRTYRKDETVVERATEDRDVYFLVSGSARIVNFSLSGRPVAYASFSASWRQSTARRAPPRLLPTSLASWQRCRHATSSI